MDEEVRRGPLEPALAAELPGLRLRFVTVAARPGAPSRALRDRLRELSDRHRGLDLVALRTRPIPRAYRALYRQIGLDPDVERIAAERAAVRRVREGGLVPEEQLADACRIAALETGVGVWALDAAAVAPDGPGVRGAGGSLVVADAGRVHAALFGEPRTGSAPRRHTRRVVLYAVGAPGVPEVHLHEALWLAGDAARA